MILEPTRRTAALGALLAGCATARPVLEGRPTYSESVMLSGADAEGRNFCAVRICTYPELGLAWLWCMLLTPEGFWQYASNDVAWSGAAVAQEPVVASYGAFATRRTSAIIKREGTLAAPRRAELQASFDSMHSLGEPGRPVGRGTISILASFEPAAGYGGLLPGRTESFGRTHFYCTGDGVSAVFDGPGQFHEQPQTEPRFTTPFVFASLWSADVFATALQTAQGAGGYVIDNGRAQPMKAVTASVAPGALGIDFSLGDTPRRFVLESARDYRVPVYGLDWRGRLVRGRYGERQVVGFLNSWKM
jgi:hypothetical protein